jgi:segregation and condensation protein B
MSGPNPKSKTQEQQSAVEQSPESLPSAIESLLFAADEPLSLRRLAEILDAPTVEIEKALVTFDKTCQGRGVRLARVSGGYQLLTRPEFAPFIQKLRQTKPDHLSRAALETLAIVAYKQPVTRPEIDHIRGVDASYSLDALLSRHLIKEAGRKNSPGRPFLFKTTDQFLRTFGLPSLSDLPPLRGDLDVASFPSLLSPLSVEEMEARRDVSPDTTPDAPPNDPET